VAVAFVERLLWPHSKSGLGHMKSCALPHLLFRGLITTLLNAMPTAPLKKAGFQKSRSADFAIFLRNQANPALRWALKGFFDNPRNVIIFRRHCHFSDTGRLLAPRRTHRALSVHAFYFREAVDE